MKKILVVVDMQNDFLTGSLGSEECLDVVDSVAEKIANWDGDIMVTLDTHRKDYMDTQEGKFLPVPHCIEGTPGWELNEKVERALVGKRAVKVRKNTFGSVRLAEMIVSEKPEEVFFVGVCTDICVVSNALCVQAALRNAEAETRLYVDPVCCAGTSKEAHEAAIRVLNSCQISLV